MKEPFEEKLISSFDELTYIISRIQEDRRFREFTYRGQSEAIWELIPSIFRDSLDKNLVSDQWLKERIKEEFEGVKYFVRIADEMGFDLPGDLFPLLNLRDLDSFGYSKWYFLQNSSFIEVTTIAQHHGIRTRFMDFTFDPYVAIYFAAEEVVRKLTGEIERAQNSDDRFSLWMIDRLYLFNPNCLLIHFVASTARNKYLNAQRGLFLSTPLPSIDSYQIQAADFNLKEVAIKNCKKIAIDGPGAMKIWPVIWKLNFPFNLAPEILRKLDSRGTNLTTIKPNLDNIMPYKKFRELVNKLWSDLRKNNSTS